MYVNPWKNTENLKIVEFESNGNVKLKDISKDLIINVTPITDAMKANTTSNLPHLEGRNLNSNGKSFTDPLSNAKKYLKKLKGNARLKILTRCNDSRTMCRFLACPNIKVNCILCEIMMPNVVHPSLSPGLPKITNCEVFNTKYLT